MKRPEKWINTYYNIKGRCGNKNSRYYKNGIKCLITKDELKELWFRDNAYLMKKPSIDRVDSKGHYEYLNCRYIEFSENARLGNLNRETSSKQSASSIKNIAIANKRERKSMLDWSDKKQVNKYKREWQQRKKELCNA